MQGSRIDDLVRTGERYLNIEIEGEKRGVGDQSPLIPTEIRNSNTRYTLLSRLDSSVRGVNEYVKYKV